MVELPRDSHDQELDPKANNLAHELWLHKNNQALKDVQEGLKQSKEGKVRKRGSFAKYVEDMNGNQERES